MKLADVDEMVTRRARRVLRRSVERDKDLRPVIIVIRGAEEIAIVQPPSTDEMLTAVSMAAAGFSADVVALINDSYKATNMTNPMTGEQWQPGEMEDAVRNHRGIEQGWVHDCLNVVIVNRAGDVHVHSITYARQGKSVTWLQDSDFEREAEDTSFGGRIPDTLRAIMNEPDIITKMEPDLQAAVDAGLLPVGRRPDSERMRALTDAACVEALARHDCLVAVQAEPGSERAKEISRMAGRAHGMVHIEKPWSDN